MNAETQKMLDRYDELQDKISALVDGSPDVQNYLANVKDLETLAEKIKESIKNGEEITETANYNITKSYAIEYDPIKLKEILGSEADFYITTKVNKKVLEDAIKKQSVSANVDDARREGSPTIRFTRKKSMNLSI